MVNIASAGINRLKVGKRVTLEGNKAEIDTLKIAKIGIQKVSGKKFIGTRSFAQEILYAVDEKKNDIYILGAFAGKTGEGIGKRKTAKVTSSISKVTMIMRWKNF